MGSIKFSKFLLFIFVSSNLPSSGCKKRRSRISRDVNELSDFDCKSQSMEICLLGVAEMFRTKEIGPEVCWLSDDERPIS